MHVCMHLVTLFIGLVQSCFVPNHSLVSKCGNGFTLNLTPVLRCQVIHIESLKVKMANLPAGGVKSLRTHLEVPGATSDDIIRNWDRTETMKPYTVLPGPNGN